MALFLLNLPFPLVIGGAALLGLAVAAMRPHWLALKPAGDSAPLGPRPWKHTLGVVALWGAVWAAPVALVALTLGRDHVLWDVATFFSQLAVVTFGGAYAVLAWVAQEAVGTYGWLQPGEMLDGLGMAETTPGPLIMVLQFVGFMGALREAGWASPYLAGTLGGLLTTWVTFAPCFAWIFLGAPFMEGLRRNLALSAALSAVTAAVVGVILNLALWFAIHVVWTEVQRVTAGPVSMELPVLSSVNWVAALLSALALIAVFRLKLGMASVLGGSAALGLMLYVAGIV